MTIPQHCVDDVAAVTRRIEQCIDEALSLNGQLFGELVKAQTEGCLHPIFMHSDIFARLAPLTTSLIATRGDAAELHKGMNRVADKLGLTRSDLDGPPESKTWPPKSGVQTTESADVKAPAVRTA